MDKPLTQITFEFSGSEDAEIGNNSGVGIARIKPKPMPQAESPVTVKKTGSTRGRRSLKDIGLSADLIQVPEDEILFQKQYYSIGEVAGMFKENQSLIRYWEIEFDILQPRKNRKGDRFFRPIDVKNLVLIYDLLRRRKFTIEGAKDYLKKNKKAEEKFAMIQSLEKIKSFLLEIKATL
jgi:DNA-binding transcriptional MerR regulator